MYFLAMIEGTVIGMGCFSLGVLFTAIKTKFSQRDSKPLKLSQKHLIALFGVGILSIVLEVIITIHFILIPVDKHEYFRKDVIMIRPYVEESEIIRLEAKWVSMETKSDYDIIYEYIDAVKKENSLKLR